METEPDDELWAAIADPSRRRVLDLIVQRGEATASSLADQVPFTRQAVSKHLVVLEHGFGITTRYGHLSRLAVADGQEVSRGDIIGYVGSTGRSTSPHLHYEVLVNGRLTNPLKLLTSR